MPVRLDDVYPDISEIPDTTRSLILALLYNYPEYGYRPKEVREGLNLPHGTATICLKHLNELEYVEKTNNGYYHAVEDHEDIRQFVASLDHLNRMFNHPKDGGGVSLVEGDCPIKEILEQSEIEAELAELQCKIEEQ